MDDFIDDAKREAIREMAESFADSMIMQQNARDDIADESVQLAVGIYNRTLRLKFDTHGRAMIPPPLPATLPAIDQVKLQALKEKLEASGSVSAAEVREAGVDVPYLFRLEQLLADASTPAGAARLKLWIDTYVLVVAASARD